MRAIDGDKLKESIKKQLTIARLIGDFCDDKELMDTICNLLEQGAMQEIDNAPTIELEEKPGRWIRTSKDLEKGTIHCNACGTEFDYYLSNQLAVESCGTVFPKHCPNCGVCMGNKE